MNTYFALFLLTTVASVTLTPLVRRACERAGWLDAPGDARRVHRRAVPRLGGVAIYAAVVAPVLALAFVENELTRQVAADRAQLVAALVPATLVFLFGVYDDVRGTNARMKFAALGAAGALFYALGGRVEVLSVPMVGTVELPAAVSFAVTVVWVTFVANAFNLIDGVDGLAAGAALFASLVMLVVALWLGNLTVAVAACAMCGALVGFLRYNFNPASVFMGDSGALFIGFALAALSVTGAQKASTAVAVAIPLLAFGVPVVDTGFTLVRRFLSRRPLFEGDREHIHHMLLDRGWSQRRVAFVLYGASALFGMAALFSVHDAGGVTGLLLFIVAVAVVLAVGRLHYHEVDELRASVRRNVSGRRSRAANNIRVRRATRAMSEAQTLDSILDAVRDMLEPGEFVYALLQLKPHDTSTHAVTPFGGNGHGNGSRQVRWSWARGDVAPAEVLESGRYWALRLPLATERGEWGYLNLYRECDADQLLLDINYLCNPFQRQTALAAERVMQSAAACEEEVAPAVPLVYEARV